VIVDVVKENDLLVACLSPILQLLRGYKSRSFYGGVMHVGYLSPNDDLFLPLSSMGSTESSSYTYTKNVNLKNYYEPKNVWTLKYIYMYLLPFHHLSSYNSFIIVSCFG
jgi:hypothetical protein